MRSFLEAVQGDRLEALYVLAISTGMRQGELLGLRWQDVDVERRRLQLVRQLKTRQSRRAVVLRQRSFFPLLDRAGLPRIRFHDLRHSCATLLLGEGVHPKIVSDLLGHSQIGITLDLYSHVTATMQAVAAEAMGRLLSDQDGSG